MYPWQACLDEATNCYYYWNMETNEVQWHPPEQFLSAAPDTQTADDEQPPGLDGEEKCELDDLEDKADYEEAKGDLEIQIAAICLVVYYHNVTVRFTIIVTVVKIGKEK